MHLRPASNPIKPCQDALTVCMAVHMGPVCAWYRSQPIRAPEEVVAHPLTKAPHSNNRAEIRRCAQAT